MEKLILLSEDGVSQEIPLIEQRISIGRDEHSAVCLSDKSVSRHHATLQRVYGGFTIQDEGSTNGTRVNGRVITKQFLKHRDLIEIGKYHLRFVQEAIPEQSAEDVDKTVVIRPMPQPGQESPPEKPGSGETHRAKAGAQPQAGSTPESKQALGDGVDDSAFTQAHTEAAPESKQASKGGADGSAAKICYLAGDQKGQEKVVDRAFFSVGKAGGDLVLINKRHTGYFLLKVGGDVPPTINGTPIKAGGVELHDGDRIELGELMLEFRI